MTFLLLAGALALASALAVALPALGRRRGAPDRAEASLAIFRDQLAEVERDAARGLVSGADAEAARTEIGRRMLAAARSRGPAPARSGRAAVLAGALAVPLLGAGLYALVGRPDVPSLPFAERGSERAAAAEIEGLTAELRRRLETDPEGGPTEGWVLLAQTHLRRGQYEEAVRAFEVASARPDAAAGVLTQHAEALIGREGGIVTPPALALVERALERDPSIPAAHFYRAQALAQSGDPAGAREVLLDRLAEARGPEPWAEVFVAEVNRLGAEAGLEPVAARDVVPGLAEVQDMTEEDREAAIRTMVDGLAARLEVEPEDLEGWLRLGQARAVLGEGAEARAAYERALALMPRDDPRRAQVAAALEAPGP